MKLINHITPAKILYFLKQLPVIFFVSFTLTSHINIFSLGE